VTWCGSPVRWPCRGAKPLSAWLRGMIQPGGLCMLSAGRHPGDRLVSLCLKSKVSTEGWLGAGYAVGPGWTGVELFFRQNRPGRKIRNGCGDQELGRTGPVGVRGAPVVPALCPSAPVSSPPFSKLHHYCGFRDVEL
jgi:hypothetical protein